VPISFQTIFQPLIKSSRSRGRTCAEYSTIRMSNILHLSLFIALHAPADRRHGLFRATGPVVSRRPILTEAARDVRKIALFSAQRKGRRTFTDSQSTTTLLLYLFYRLFYRATPHQALSDPDSIRCPPGRTVITATHWELPRDRMVPSDFPISRPGTPRQAVRSCELRKSDSVVSDDRKGSQ
jgi:hypothetical protein